jgi:uncharacterized protein (DUF1684 family)
MSPRATSRTASSTRAEHGVGAPADPLRLAHWRRTVAEIYAALRAAAERDLAGAATKFRAERDGLFRDHPDSPIPVERRRDWRGTRWFDYDPAWRFVAAVEPDATRREFEIDLASDGILRCARIGHARFGRKGADASLALYWLEGYGGGVWLPFLDATSGAATYGGGRYLYDTIKGADLGIGAKSIVLDFNFAYNPSCAYDERWSCPLSPQENRLPFAVNAGERMP